MYAIDTILDVEKLAECIIKWWGERETREKELNSKKIETDGRIACDLHEFRS